MRIHRLFLLLCMLGPLSGLVAEVASFKTFSQGLGVNLGLASGLGVSYRDLDRNGGWQWTGIVYKNPSGSTSTPVAFSGGLGLIKPIGVYPLVEWLDVMLYLQASVVTSGTWGLERKAESLNGMAGVSGSYGFEFLFWDHLSFNFDVAQTVGASLQSDRKGPWQPSFMAIVSPQVALYFRY